MGLYDTVYCECPLPDTRHQDLDFQTKNLECLMDTYTITQDGRLVRRAGIGFGGEGLDRDTEWPLHGDIRIYTSVKTETPSWIEYVVRFTHGRVEWIRPLAEIRKDSDLPPASLDLSLESYLAGKTAEVAAEPQPAASAARGGGAPSPEGARLCCICSAFVDLPFGISIRSLGTEPGKNSCPETRSALTLGTKTG